MNSHLRVVRALHMKNVDSDKGFWEARMHSLPNTDLGGFTYYVTMNPRLYNSLQPNAYAMPYEERSLGFEMHHYTCKKLYVV